jgi:hypothetical protein
MLFSCILILKPTLHRPLFGPVHKMMPRAGARSMNKPLPLEQTSFAAGLPNKVGSGGSCPLGSSWWSRSGINDCRGARGMQSMNISVCGGDRILRVFGKTIGRGLPWYVCCIRQWATLTKRFRRLRHFCDFGKSSASDELSLRLAAIALSLNLK